MAASATAESGDTQIALSNNKDAQLHLFEFKILLLGAGESGKSTIAKQLKVIHSKQVIPEEEPNLVVDTLHLNVVECAKVLARVIEKFGIPQTQSDLAAARMLEMHADNARMTPTEAALIHELVAGQAAQQALQRKSEFWLLDSWPYLFDNVERFAAPDFSPTSKDMLIARIRTTGIIETSFDQDIVPSIPDEPSSITFKLVDVGGQRNERKKWINCFQNVKCVLFVVNLDGYHTVLFEDSSRNRMHEALELFGKTANSPVFANIPIFLFLNKADLFAQHAEQVDLKCCFRDYTGGLDSAKALSHIRRQFLAMLTNKEVTICEVTALERDSLRAKFDEVKHMLYFANKENLIGKLRALKQEEQSLLAKLKASQQSDGKCCVML